MLIESLARQWKFIDSMIVTFNGLSLNKKGAVAETIVSLQCNKYNKYRNEILSLWQKRVPLCLEVLLVASCSCERNPDSPDASVGPESGVLLEQWCLNLTRRR